MARQLQQRNLCGVCLVLALSVGGPRLAAGDPPKAEAYRELVKRVTGGDVNVDYRALRFACMRADDCDAGGEQADVVAMRRAIGEKSFDKAAKAAEKLIQTGFTNIEAHVVCSRAYAGLGNPEKANFHRDIAGGLIRSIFKTGDGKSKGTAFEVVGVHEEYVVVAIMGLPRPTGQALVTGKPHYYDVLTVEDPKTKQKMEIYFNIDAFYSGKGL